MSTIFERVEQDLQRGDHGLAKARLLSHLNSKGYEVEILNRLGRICYEMHDLFQAGRCWLTSTAQGEEVDAAIKEFARRCGRNPNQMFSQLPQRARLSSLPQYPEIVQQRLRQWSINEEVFSDFKAQQPLVSGTSIGTKIKYVIAFFIFIASIAFSIFSCHRLLN